MTRVTGQNPRVGRRVARLASATLLLFFVGCSVAGAQLPEPTECPPAPPIIGATVSDDAIETRAQRMEDSQACFAVSDRLDTLIAEGEDVRRFTGWIVGVLLVVVTIPVVARIFRASA